MLVFERITYAHRHFTLYPPPIKMATGILYCFINSTTVWSLLTMSYSKIISCHFMYCYWLKYFNITVKYSIKAVSILYCGIPMQWVWLSHCAYMCMHDFGLKLAVTINHACYNYSQQFQNVLKQLDNMPI